MNLRGRVHSCNTCISISNKVDEYTYQIREECSPTLSKDKYTYSLGNKHEELELSAQSESYAVIGFTETVGKFT